MKKKSEKVICFTVVLMLSAMLFYCSESPTDSGNDNRDPGFTELSGEYLGQTPPGSTPVLFAPGIISVDDHFEHSGAVFSPDLTEVYWSTKPDGGNIFHIYFMKMIDGQWTAPQITSFTENYDGNRHAFSPDGQRLYFETIRNPVGGPILFVERQGDAWSVPTALPPVINGTGRERMFCLTQDGSLYFARGTSLDGDEQILVSRFVNGQFTEPVELNQNVNSDLTEMYIHVAPDESYMIIESSNHTNICQLAICYRLTDGSWSERRNLPFGWARFPVVSPDGRFLFYMGGGGIYWVNTDFVDELRPVE